MPALFTGKLQRQKQAFLNLNSCGSYNSAHGNSTPCTDKIQSAAQDGEQRRDTSEVGEQVRVAEAGASFGIRVDDRNWEAL